MNMNATIEPINESIRVIAGFNPGGRLTPLLFEWRSRRFERFKIIKTWKIPEGVSQKVFFTLTPDTVNLYEIYFHTRNFQWILARIYHD
jgi:hypothetical protein